MFPYNRTRRARNRIKNEYSFGIYCTCRLPKSGNMIECSKCKEWYHINPRVQVPKEALKRGVQWICQYCLSIIVIKMSYFRVGSKCYKDPPRSKYFRGGPNTSTMMCNIWTPGSIYYYSIWTGGSILGGSIFFVTGHTNKIFRVIPVRVNSVPPW